MEDNDLFDVFSRLLGSFVQIDGSSFRVLAVNSFSVFLGTKKGDYYREFPLRDFPFEFKGEGSFSISDYLRSLEKQILKVYVVGAPGKLSCFLTMIEKVLEDKVCLLGFFVVDPKDKSSLCKAVGDILFYRGEGLYMSLDAPIFSRCSFFPA